MSKGDYHYPLTLRFYVDISVQRLTFLFGSGVLGLFLLTRLPSVPSSSVFPSVSVSSLKVYCTKDVPLPPVCVSTTIYPLHTLQPLVTQRSFSGEQYSREPRQLAPQINNPTTSSLFVPRFLPPIVSTVPPSTVPMGGMTEVISGRELLPELLTSTELLQRLDSSPLLDPTPRSSLELLVLPLPTGWLPADRDDFISVFNSLRSCKEREFRRTNAGAIVDLAALAAERRAMIGERWMVSLRAFNGLVLEGECGGAGSQVTRMDGGSCAGVVTPVVPMVPSPLHLVTQASKTSSPCGLGDFR